jgi:two-component system, chemotaxis family, chemotaxis protein CheY
MTPTAVIVDDSPLMRQHLRTLLTQAGVQVVGEGASGDTALPLYEKHTPTLLLMDIVMPGKDGLTAATELLALHPQAAVIMCTSLAVRDKVLVALKAGVKHYLLKQLQHEKVIAAIQNIVARLQQAAPLEVAR